MARLLIRLFIVFVLVVPQVSMAQIEGEREMVTVSPRKQLATIIFFGLAGAVLGLSTLSFYGRPQDKLKNIPIGFAFGVLGGVTYTTYQTATQPYQNYEDQSLRYELQRPQVASFSMQWDF